MPTGRSLLGEFQSDLRLRQLAVEWLQQQPFLSNCRLCITVLGIQSPWWPSGSRLTDWPGFGDRLFQMTAYTYCTGHKRQISIYGPVPRSRKPSINRHPIYHPTTVQVSLIDNHVTARISWRRIIPSPIRNRPFFETP